LRASPPFPAFHLLSLLHLRLVSLYVTNSEMIFKTKKKKKKRKKRKRKTKEEMLLFDRNCFIDIDEIAKTRSYSSIIRTSSRARYREKNKNVSLQGTAELS
jgi:hypothetical protein